MAESKSDILQGTLDLWYCRRWMRWDHCMDLHALPHRTDQRRGIGGEPGTTVPA